MLSQTPEQLAVLNEEIPRIMDTVVKNDIAYWINHCGKKIERRLGLNSDDLVSRIREEVWKALLTHKPGPGQANIKTWVKKLIENRFNALMRQTKLKKYNSTEYFANVFTSGEVDQSQFIGEETGETFFERRHAFAKALGALDKSDQALLRALATGEDIKDIMAKTKQKRSEVINRINKMDELLKQSRSNG